MSIRHHRYRSFVFLVLLVLQSTDLDNNNHVVEGARAKTTDDGILNYHVIGVSGGLQDGFPERYKLDYRSGQSDEVNKAIFLGRALVRGYKPYLDVMQETYRQYVKEPGQPYINPNVFPTGCAEHANEYWIYLVDTRQVINTLNYEPRFLSITPDTGLLELEANETYPIVRQFLRQLVQQKTESMKISMDEIKRVAVPLVTAVWFHDSHVPSPTIRINHDGTEVTNFPESLALWAKVNDTDRTAISDAGCNDKSKCSNHVIEMAQQKEQLYWDGIRLAIRKAEQKRPTAEELEQYNPHTFKCKNGKVRFGVGQPGSAQVNYPLPSDQIFDTISSIGGLQIDFVKGEITETDSTFKLEL